MSTQKKPSLQKSSNKKEKNLRTSEERQTKINEIYTSLEQSQIPYKQIPGIQKFITMADDFILNGTSYSGRIPIPELKKDLLYLLNNNKKHDIIVMLKHNSTL